MTWDFGKGFTVANLKNMRQFYLTFPNSYALRSELSWTHYRLLMRVENENARQFYMEEAVKSQWSTRQLERQINTFFYESDLEQALITHLQKFLLELGRGFSFVARQKRITFDGRHFRIDLVFYNYILKCFVLIDLKTTRITHQDVGQMDMYIRMYDELKKSPDDNPTLGIVLCSETDEDIARYSILHGNEQLFASKYKLYLPTEEELREEIEAQKAVFYLQQKETEKQIKEENPLLLQEAHAMQK